MKKLLLSAAALLFVAVLFTGCPKDAWDADVTENVTEIEMSDGTWVATRKNNSETPTATITAQLDKDDFASEEEYSTMKELLSSITGSIKYIDTETAEIKVEGDKVTWLGIKYEYSIVFPSNTSNETINALKKTLPEGATVKGTTISFSDTAEKEDLAYYNTYSNTVEDFLDECTYGLTEILSNTERTKYKSSASVEGANGIKTEILLTLSKK